MNSHIGHLIPCLENRKVCIIGKDAQVFSDYFEILTKPYPNYYNLKYIGNDEIEMSDLIAKDIILVYVYRDCEVSERILKNLNTKIKDIYNYTGNSHIIATIVPKFIFPLTDTDINSDPFWLHSYLQDSYKYVTIIGHSYVKYFELLFKEIIDSLIERVAHVLGLSHHKEMKLFYNWLDQFTSDESNYYDKALILRLMQNFRFYSANTIIKLYDILLDKNTSDIYDDDRIDFFNEHNILVSNIWFSFLGRANKSGPATLPLIGKTKWLQTLIRDSEKHKPGFYLPDKLVTNLIYRLDENENETICLVFIDDYIGSGGQLINYGENFIEDELTPGIDSINHPMIRKKIKDNLIKAFNSNRIKIFALYAIGVYNTHINDAIFGNIRPLPHKDATYGTRPISGELSHTSIISELSNEPISVSINVHIADLTESVAEIFQANELLKLHELEKLNNILLRYRKVVKARDKEHWGQFAPLGWKDSGSLTATFSNCQGNTIPVVWGEGLINNDRSWIPLFRRYFNPWSTGEADAKQMLENVMPILNEVLNSSERETDMNSDFLANALSYALEKRTNFFNNGREELIQNILSSEQIPPEIKEIFEKISHHNIIQFETELDNIVESIINSDKANGKRMETTEINKIKQKYSYIIEVIRACD